MGFFYLTHAILVNFHRYSFFDYKKNYSSSQTYKLCFNKNRFFQLKYFMLEEKAVLDTLSKKKKNSYESQFRLFRCSNYVILSLMS